MCQSFFAIPAGDDLAHPISPDLLSVDESGFPVVLTAEESCTACQFCNDTCSLADCTTCSDKRQRLRSVRKDRTDSYFTPCEVARHRTLGSCWIVVNGSVYDCTKYLSRHPGGIPSILSRGGGGADASEDIQYHSKQAQKLLEKFRIGALIQCGQVVSSSDPGCSIC